MSYPILYTLDIKIDNIHQTSKIHCISCSGSTHNFIPQHVIEETHYYILPISNFQIMISNGGMMKCGSCSEKSEIQNG